MDIFDGWMGVSGDIFWVCGHFLWVGGGGWGIFWVGGDGWRWMGLGGGIFWLGGSGWTFFTVGWE